MPIIGKKPLTYGMVRKPISLEAGTQVGSSGNGKEGTLSEVFMILSMGIHISSG